VRSRSYARRFHYGVVRDFTRHGVGEAFTPASSFPLRRQPAYATEIEVGMVFTIEPVTLTLGGSNGNVGRRLDRASPDRSITAQFEHTMVRDRACAEVLTLPDRGPTHRIYGHIPDMEELAARWLPKQ
jgi:methionyl aminopeptidase